MSQSHSYNLRKRPCPIIEDKAPKVAKLTKATKPEIKVKVAKSVKVPKIQEKEVVKESKSSKPPKAADKDVVETKVSRVTKADKIQVVKPPKAIKLHEKEEKNNFIFGQDSCGELGFGRIGFTKKLPVAMPLGRVRQIACGPMHVITLLETGQVYTNGCNDEGALGRVTDGDEKLEATPTLVPIPNTVIKITAGDSHSAVLTDKDEVFVMGNFRDEGGQVGLTPESKESSFKPVQILPNIKLKDIASGSNHMLLLDDKGVVYSFGTGEQGQLGRIDEESLNRVTDENRCLLLTPMKVDLSKVHPMKVDANFICDRVYAGNYSSFATNTDKKRNLLAAWGLNNYYQLGYMVTGHEKKLVENLPIRSIIPWSTSMINVACGQHHTLFLDKNGVVHVAGRSEYGMLGVNIHGPLCPPRRLKSVADDIVDIAASINTSFAVNSKGQLFSWGMGGIQLGHGNEDDVPKPTIVSSLEEQKVLSVSSGTTFTAVITKPAG